MAEPRTYQLSDKHTYRIEPHPEREWCTVLVIGSWRAVHWGRKSLRERLADAWRVFKGGEEVRVQLGLSEALNLSLRLRSAWRDAERRTRVATKAVREESGDKR